MSRRRLARMQGNQRPAPPAGRRNGRDLFRVRSIVDMLSGHQSSATAAYPRSVQAKGKSMPAPTTIDEFLDVAKKSGVVDEKRLAGHIDKLRAAGQLPSRPVDMATQLVRDGLLTHFQAEQFLQGKW